MPVGPGRYRVVTTKSGGKIRLHFVAGKDGVVNEAKNLDTGATHSPKEFMNDRIRGKKGH